MHDIEADGEHRERGVGGFAKNGGVVGIDRREIQSRAVDFVEGLQLRPERLPESDEARLVRIEAGHSRQREVLLLAGPDAETTLARSGELLQFARRRRGALVEVGANGSQRGRDDGRRHPRGHRERQRSAAVFAAQPQRRQCRDDGGEAARVQAPGSQQFEETRRDPGRTRSRRELPRRRDCARAAIPCPASTELPQMPDPYNWLASL